jgi:MscS family membrane protein
MKRLLLLPLFVLTLHAGFAQSEPGEFNIESPRACFDTYLLAMVNFSKAEDPALQQDHLDAAVRCLDLRGVAATLRTELGKKYAKELKIFLDKYEIVVMEDIPESYAADKYVWRRPVETTEISLIRTEDSLWLFSQATIESLPLLLESVQGEEVVEGVETTIEQDSFADWVRGGMSDGLNKRSLLLENWQWIALLILVVIGAIIDKLIAWILSAWITHLLKRREDKPTYKIKNTLLRPVGIFAMAYFWSIAITLLDLPLQVLNILYFATQFVMAVSGVWTAYNAVDIVAGYFSAMAERTTTKFDDLLVRMLSRLLKILVVAFGLLFVADNFDIDITSLLAGVGIGGIALALAAKDTVENLFGSVTVLVDHPFEIGDWIKVGDLEGSVEDVGFRSTRIRTFYNSLISMPNSMLVNRPLDNMGRREYRRISTKLGIQYDTPPEKIDAFCEGIRELIRLHPYTRKDLYMVYLNEFADSSLNILLYVFHKTPDWTTELAERHRLFVDIVRLAKRLGVEFAFPTQTLHVSSFPGAELSPEQQANQPKEEEARREAKPGFITQSIEPKDTEDAMFIGRREAQAIVNGMWGDLAQNSETSKSPGSINSDATLPKRE